MGGVGGGAFYNNVLIIGKKGYVPNVPFSLWIGGGGGIHPEKNVRNGSISCILVFYIALLGMLERKRRVRYGPV